MRDANITPEEKTLLKNTLTTIKDFLDSTLSISSKNEISRTLTGIQNRIVMLRSGLQDHCVLCLHFKGIGGDTAGICLSHEEFIERNQFACDDYDKK